MTAKAHPKHDTCAHGKSTTERVTKRTTHGQELSASHAKALENDELKGIDLPITSFDFDRKLCAEG